MPLLVSASSHQEIAPDLSLNKLEYGLNDLGILVEDTKASTGGACFNPLPRDVAVVEKSNHFPSARHWNETKPTHGARARFQSLLAQLADDASRFTHLEISSDESGNGMGEEPETIKFLVLSSHLLAVPADGLLPLPPVALHPPLVRPEKCPPLVVSAAVRGWRAKVTPYFEIIVGPASHTTELLQARFQAGSSILVRNLTIQVAFDAISDLFEAKTTLTNIRIIFSSSTPVN
ncbi:hypothetical protein BKA70DRAFT_1433287 [Coprinopsis sp. MPI-PUGE-AT-0042]|nr:hypothetical protein BKA70DRAFT_1433287 [Coprinopsis sp. MPI-PUGE-AT-0042]